LRFLLGNAGRAAPDYGEDWEIWMVQPLLPPEVVQVSLDSAEK